MDQRIVHVCEHVLPLKHDADVAEVRALAEDGVLVKAQGIHNEDLAALDEVYVARIVERFAQGGNVYLFWTEDAWLLAELAHPWLLTHDCLRHIVRQVHPEFEVEHKFAYELPVAALKNVREYLVLLLKD